MTDQPKIDDVLFDPRPQPDEHPAQRALLHAAAEEGAKAVSASEKQRAESDRSEPPSPGKAERAERQERLLDEGVEETFPASDPVSVKRVD